MFQRYALASALLAVGLIIPLVTHPNAASAKEEARHLSLSGTGQVLAEPDMAIIRTGVVTQGATAKEALDENTNRMTAVIAAFKAAGIPDKDLGTENFSIQPEYEYHRNNNGVQRPPKIVAYRVNNTAVITVRDLTRLGAILDQSVVVGANTIQGPIFDVSEKGPLIEEARRKAARNALGKAETYADELGFTLGPVVSISEGRVSQPRPKQVMMMRSADAAVLESAPVPIEGGEVGLSVSVSITWDIED